MAAAPRPDLYPTPKLRAHRPLQGDSYTVPRADAAYSMVTTQAVPKRPAWIRRHLFHFGVGMLLMLALWVVMVWYVMPFTQDKIDHWNCGQDRICQYNFNVGHGGTSHFIAEYWQQQVMVIEFVGTSSNVHVYSRKMIVVGTDQPRIVTLTPDYVSRHPVKGKPDLIATVTGFSLAVIFYNTGSGFSTEAG